MAYNYNPYYYNNGATPDILSQYKGQYQQPPVQNFQQPIQQMPQNFQQMPMQTPVQQNEPQKINNGFIWVQGEAGAKAYLVSANNTVVLWDTESPTIYVKSADVNGVPSMQILDFEYRNNAPQKPTEHACQCGDKFVTKEELKALQGKYDDLTAKYDDLMSKITEKTKATSKKTKGDVE